MTTHSDQDTLDHPSLEEPRPGHELRTARERAGMSRESIAERLRLASDQLDALERDDYSDLPPPAFVRGYFRAYARELGLDPDEYIAAYNRSAVAAADPEIRSGSVTDTPSSGRGGLIGLVLIALVAAGGIGAWWYQQRMGAGNDDSGGADSVEEASTAAGGSSTDSDSPDAASGDSDGDEAAVGEQATSDEAASVGGDTDADTASADGDAQGATIAAAAEGDEDAADNVDGTADASGGSGEDRETADNAMEQPVVASMEPESTASDGDGAAGGGTEEADAGNTGNASVTEEEADDTVTAEEADNGEADNNEADNDTGTDSTAAAAEPGATSPAATDSPTRAATEAASSGPDQITLGFSSRSWLEVYDDRDRELVYTLYFGSEPITLQGWAPFEIFLGNSPAVTVEFNGEEIDKSAFTRGNNTARFVVDASGVRSP